MPCPVNDRILLILYSLEMCINNVTHRQYQFIMSAFHQLQLGDAYLRQWTVS